MHLNLLWYLLGWRFSAVVASFVARSCSTLSPVSTEMGDRLRAGIPPWYVTKPTRSTQPCIPLGSLNRVPALIGWGNGGVSTSPLQMYSIEGSTVSCSCVQISGRCIASPLTTLFNCAFSSFPCSSQEKLLCLYRRV